MIARRQAERLISEALLDPPFSASGAERRAARLVDDIYGVDGADAINPEHGTKHYQEHEAD